MNEGIFITIIHMCSKKESDVPGILGLWEKSYRISP